VVKIGDEWTASFSDLEQAVKKIGLSEMICG